MMRSRIARRVGTAQRALVPGGRILMIEPWVSAWSRFVYTRLHPEPFRPEASAVFRKRFPRLEVTRVEPFMPFRYLVSRGVPMRALAPVWRFRAWKGLERLLAPLMGQLAMFAFIAVERR